jgi:hypothetical protein
MCRFEPRLLIQNNCCLSSKFHRYRNFPLPPSTIILSFTDCTPRHDVREPALSVDISLNLSESSKYRKILIFFCFAVVMISNLSLFKGAIWVIKNRCFT